MLVDVSEPLGNVVEALSVCDIVDQHDPHSTPRIFMKISFFHTNTLIFVTLWAVNANIQLKATMPILKLCKYSLLIYT